LPATVASFGYTEAQAKKKLRNQSGRFNFQPKAKHWPGESTVWVKIIATPNTTNLGSHMIGADSLSCC
jgi:pyruvate/2-oxoglutarate dehydrogenase complex dihydrolipoamide dehydrogenase (E3) component